MFLLRLFKFKGSQAYMGTLGGPRGGVSWSWVPGGEGWRGVSGLQKRSKGVVSVKKYRKKSLQW